jgi:hypothetical protein
MSKERQAATASGGSLSSESLARLGLDADVDVRVVARSGRTMLLESGAGDSMLPRDRDLVLSCDVRAFALADLLSLVHRAGKSGYLLFEHDGEAKAVYLSRGEVVFASSNLLADRLGPCLLRSGLIDQDQLELAESRYDPSTRFGKVVVEMGMLTPRDLWAGVKTQVEEIVRSLFSYTNGWIHFWEGEIEPDNVVRLSLPTNRLIDEGLERRDELLLFLGRLEDARTRIREGTVTRPPASEKERAIMDALGVDERFQGVCHRSGLDPRTAARTLRYLQESGRVVIEREGETGGAEFGSADDDVVREAVSLHTKLLIELAAPLVALDGPEAVAERLNRVREESAASGRRLLDGIEFNGHAALDPDAVEHRALRLPGDRVREVDEALGEIVAYLEFELKNHPRIDDSTPFLEAVDPLRAMLIR